jgi:hypothetical protein
MRNYSADTYSKDAATVDGEEEEEQKELDCPARRGSESYIRNANLHTAKSGDAGVCAFQASSRMRRRDLGRRMITHITLYPYLLRNTTRQAADHCYELIVNLVLFSASYRPSISTEGSLSSC